LSLYFADTSAFAKRYLPETGSSWVKSWIEPSAGNITFVSEISTVEFISLLARRQREKTVSSADFHRLQNDFLVHARREYRVISLTSIVLQLARQLLVRHPLRTLDALQLASAQAVTRAVGSSSIFVSADKNLLSAASAEGFAVDNPNAHP
jgi:predicted nucleic acid-binding protein